MQVTIMNNLSRLSKELFNRNAELDVDLVIREDLNPLDETCEDNLLCLKN